MTDPHAASVPSGSRDHNLHQTTLPPELEQFLDQLVAEKGVPTGKIQQTKADLRPLLQKAVNLAHIAALPEPQQHQAAQMIIDDKSPQEIQKFYADNLPNQAEIVTEALNTFRRQYLKLAK